MVAILPTFLYLLGFFDDIDLIDTDLIGNALNNQASASETFDELFQILLNSEMYNQIVLVAVGLSAFSLIAFLAMFLNQSSLMEPSSIIQGVFISLLMVILLANNAALWKGVLKAEKQIFNQVNQSVLTAIIDGKTADQTARDARIKNAGESAYAARFQECLANRLWYELPHTGGQGSQHKKTEEGYCNHLAERARRAAIGQAEDVEQRSEEDLSWVGIMFLSFLNLILGWIHAAFQIMIEVGFMLAALLSPFALVLSIAPGQPRTILRWQSQVFSLGVMKISFNLITFLVSFLYIKSESDTIMSGLVFPIVLGVFAPILATLIGNAAGTYFTTAFMGVLGRASILIASMGGQQGARAGKFVGRRFRGV